MLVSYLQTKKYHTPEDSNLQSQCHKNLKYLFMSWHKAHNIRRYVMWQKSNETDFLLTMNFILFTNQDYPLQNSSLGQLHSDGGVIFIVRGSAGKLLLEYLSARQLRASGYYPKYQNGALSSGF